MTTDPHLEADCAWLEGLKDKTYFSGECSGSMKAAAAEHNTRTDRLIASAGSGQAPINVDNEPDFLGHLVEYKSPTAGTVFIPSGEPIPLSSGCIVTPVYSGPQNVTAPASPVGGPDLLREVADQIFDRWDKDQRAGKLLAALAGRSPGYDQRVDQIRQALASPAPTPEGWRRIETAPRDGNYVIVTGHGRVDMRSAKSGEQTTDMLGPKGWDFPSWATHWQPLPVPPPASKPEED